MKLGGPLDATWKSSNPGSEEEYRNFFAKSGGGLGGQRVSSFDSAFGSHDPFEKPATLGGNGGSSGSRAADLAALGLSERASPQEIRKAYLTLARANHPDQGGDPAKFNAMKKAYERLTSENGKQGQQQQQALNNGKHGAGRGGGGAPAFYDQGFVTKVPQQHPAQASNAAPGGFYTSQQQQDQFAKRPPPGRGAAPPMRGGGGRGGAHVPPSSTAPADATKQPQPPKRDPTKENIVGTMAVPLATLYVGGRVNFDFVRLMPCDACGGGANGEGGAAARGKAKSRQSCFECGGAGTTGGWACQTCSGTGMLSAPEPHCADCGGKRVTAQSHSVAVDLAPRTPPGSSVTVSKQGHLGATDVVVTVEAESDKHFVVSGSDLVMTRRIALKDAVSGYKSVVVMPGSTDQVPFACATPVATGSVVSIPDMGFQGGGKLLVVFVVESDPGGFPVPSGHKRASPANSADTASALSAARSRGIKV